MPVPYIISGTFLNYDGKGIYNAVISFTYNSVTKSTTTDSNGFYTFNMLAFGDYNIGDTLTGLANWNNQIYSTTDTITLSGTGLTKNFSFLEQRTPQDLAFQREHDAYLGARKVTVVNQATDSFDLVNNPANTWSITRSDGQPDSETVTLANGDVYKRTYAYNSSNILISRSAWIKQ